VSPLDDLAKFVRSFSDNALLIIAFNEASNIPKKVLEYLKRHIESFQILPVWTVLLSTNDAMNMIMPPVRNEPTV
jgi:hypothetical protein